MRWLHERITPLRIFLSLAVMMLVVAVPLACTWWMPHNAQASGPDLAGLPRIKSASSLYGPTTGKGAHRIHPDSVIPGRRMPGLAGHAGQPAGHNVLSAHSLHSNTALAPNVVVSDDMTPAPFGPEPR